MKAFLIHENQYQNQDTCAKNHHNKWPNKNWPAVLINFPTNLAKLGKLDVKFSQREKCVIFLNFNSEPQASRIWPLTFSYNIGINTKNLCSPQVIFNHITPRGGYTTSILNAWLILANNGKFQTSKDPIIHTPMCTNSTIDNQRFSQIMILCITKQEEQLIDTLNKIRVLDHLVTTVSTT